MKHPIRESCVKVVGYVKTTEIKGVETKPVSSKLWCLHLCIQMSFSFNIEKIDKIKTFCDLLIDVQMFKLQSPIGCIWSLGLGSPVV